MEKYNQIFNSIFKQALSDQSSKSLIENVTKEYPYFSPAQLFLLHLTDKNSIVYAEQAKKTSLHFNNNYWLNFQLLELSKQKKDFTNTNEALAEQTTEVLEEKVNSFESEYNTSATDSSFIPMASENDSAITTTIISDELPIENQAAANEPIATQDLSFIEETIKNIPVVTKASTESTEKIPISQPELIEPIAEIELTHDTLDTKYEAYKQEDSAEEILDEDELPVDDDDLQADDEMKQVSVKIAESLSSIAADKSSASDTISFEPLHTSDYFASVGIKLSEEIKSSDRLGLQMKSFTQWLKTMKKVHADQLKETGFTDSQLSVQNDQTIQELAEASNKENIVVTESMAEVLVQQGKIVKAIELYEKLSLLDPSKKAYFAAKLNQLKG